MNADRQRSNPSNTMRLTEIKNDCSTQVVQKQNETGKMLKDTSQRNSDLQSNFWTRREKGTSVFVDGLYEEPTKDHSYIPTNIADVHRTNTVFLPTRSNQSLIGSLQHHNNTYYQSTTVLDQQHKNHLNVSITDFRSVGTYSYQTIPLFENPSQANYLMRHSEALNCYQNDMLSREVHLRSKIKPQHLPQSIPVRTQHLPQSVPVRTQHSPQSVPVRTDHYYTSEPNASCIDEYNSKFASSNSINSIVSRNYNPHRNEFPSRQIGCTNLHQDTSNSPYRHQINSSLEASNIGQKVNGSNSEDKKWENRQSPGNKEPFAQTVKDTTGINRIQFTTYNRTTRNKSEEDVSSNDLADTISHNPVSSVNSQNMSTHNIQGNKSQNNKDVAIKNVHNVNHQFGYRNTRKGNAHDGKICVGTNEEETLNEEAHIDKSYMCLDEKYKLIRQNDIAREKDFYLESSTRNKSTISRAMSEILREKQFSPKQKMLQKFRCETKTLVNADSKMVVSSDIDNGFNSCDETLLRSPESQLNKPKTEISLEDDINNRMYLLRQETTSRYNNCPTGDKQKLLLTVTAIKEGSLLTPQVQCDMHIDLEKLDANKRSKSFEETTEKRTAKCSEDKLNTNTVHVQNVERNSQQHRYDIQQSETQDTLSKQTGIIHVNVLVNESFSQSDIYPIDNKSDSDISLTVAESISDIFIETENTKKSTDSVETTRVCVCSSTNDVLEEHKNYCDEPSNMTEEQTSQSSLNLDLKTKVFVVKEASVNDVIIKLDNSVVESVNRTDTTGCGSNEEMQDNNIVVVDKNICQTYSSSNITNLLNGSDDSVIRTAFDIAESETIYETSVEDVSKDYHSVVHNNLNTEQCANNENLEGDKKSGTDCSSATVCTDRVLTLFGESTKEPFASQSPNSVQNDNLHTEIVSARDDIQIGEDSFYDSIEPEDSSLYRTCLEYEQEQQIDQPPSTHVNTERDQNHSDCHQPSVRCLELENLFPNKSVSMVDQTTESLEDSIIQHLNKTIDIVGKSPPQTIDSIDRIQIKKTLKCLSQRTQYDSVDRSSLSYSRDVIWDVLQLCGSCMILSQVALDRLRPCIGQRVKQLGFYPEMFIDTLTILFKQASISSSIASNIINDVTGDKDQEIQPEQIETTDLLSDTKRFFIDKEEHPKRSDVHKLPKKSTNQHGKDVEHNAGKNFLLYTREEDINQLDAKTEIKSKSGSYSTQNDAVQYFNKPSKIYRNLTPLKLSCIRTSSGSTGTNDSYNECPDNSVNDRLLSKQDVTCSGGQEGNCKEKMASRFRTQLKLPNHTNRGINYCSEYMKYKKERKLKRLEHKKRKLRTNHNRNAYSSRGTTTEKMSTRSKFGTSRSCLKLTQDLFGSKEVINKLKLPSSIVLNYNEASRFCCHVVLTRTPTDQTRSVLREQKQSPNKKELKSETILNCENETKDKINSNFQRSASASDLTSNSLTIGMSSNSYIPRMTSDENEVDLADKDACTLTQMGSAEINPVTLPTQNAGENLKLTKHIITIPKNGATNSSTIQIITAPIDVDTNSQEVMTLTGETQRNSDRVCQLNVKYVSNRECDEILPKNTGEISRLNNTNDVSVLNKTGDALQNNTGEVSVQNNNGDVMRNNNGVVWNNTGDVVRNNTGDVSMQNNTGDVMLNNTGDVSLLNNTGDVSELNNTGDVSVQNNTGDVVQYNTGDVVRNNTGDVVRNNTGDVSVQNNTGDVVLNNGDVPLLNNTGDVSEVNNTGNVSVQNNTGDVVRYNTGDTSVLNGSGDVSLLNNNGDVVRNNTSAVSVMNNTGYGSVLKASSDVLVRNNTGDVVRNNTGDASVWNNTFNVVRNNTGDVSLQNNIGDVSELKNTGDVVQNNTGDVSQLKNTDDASVLNNTGTVVLNTNSDVSLLNNTGDVSVLNNTGDASVWNNTFNVVRNNTGDVSLLNNIGDISEMKNTGDVVLNKTGDVSVLNNTDDVSVLNNTGNVVLNTTSDVSVLNNTGDVVQNNTGDVSVLTNTGDVVLNNTDDVSVLNNMGDVVRNNTVDVVQNNYSDVIRNNSGDALVLNNSGDVSVLNINGNVRSMTVDGVLYNTGHAVRNNTGDASMQNNTGDVSVLNNNGDAVRNNTIGLSVRNNAGDISVRNNNIQAQQPAAEVNNEILYCPAVCANSVITKHVDNVTRHANAAYQSDDKVNTGIRNFQMNKQHSVIHESTGITGLNFEMPVKQCKNHENSVSISHKRDTDGVVRNKKIVKSNSNDFRNEHCRTYKQYSCLSNRPHRKLSFEEEISLLDLPAARRSNSKKDHNTNSENKGLKETIERTKKYNSIKDTRQDTPWKHNKGNIDDSAHFENNNGVANLKIGSNPSNVESVSPAKLQRVDKKDEAIYLTTAHQTKRNFNHENILKGDRKSDNVTNKEATFINLKDVSCNKMTSSLKGLVLIRKDSSFIEDLVASLRKTLSAQSPVKLTIDLSKQKPKKENVSDLCLTKRCENEPYDKINNGRNDDNLKSSRCETKMNKALKRTVSCPENISGSPVKKHKTTDQVSISQDNSVTNDKFSGKLCDRRIKIPLITSHHTTNVKRLPNGLSESCSSKKHKTHENESSPEYCESKMDCYSNKHSKIKLKKKRSSIYDDKQYHARHRGEKGLKKENKVKSGKCNETFEKRQSNCGSISQKCKDINTPHQYLTDDKTCKHFCVKEDVAKLISKCCPQRNTLLSEEDCYTDKLVCNQGKHNCVQCNTEQAAINSGKKDDTVRHRNSSSKSTLTSKYRETNEVKKRKSSLTGTREVYTAGQVSCISDDNILLSDNTNSKNNSQNESKPSLMSTKSPQNYINETTKTMCKKVKNAQPCSKGQHNSATENSSTEFISCNNGKILPLKDCSTSVKHTKNATKLFEQNNVSKVKHKVSCDNTKTEIKVSSDHLETCSLKRNDNCQENVGDVNISKNETIIQNELEPSGKLKTDEESVFSQRKQDKCDEYQRTEDISACSKWLKLSDIYNMAPLESSDDEEDEENKQDKIKEDIVYSPLQFDTDSIDELPSLSLPTKRKKKFIRPKTNRCQRVDLNTHLEIQKILRESLPPMSSSCDGGASDDDDARTVTDFSYLSEPRQKIKNKPKSRIRFGRVSLSSSKPQIYSPQEYLSSAIGDNKQIIQSTVKIPKEEKNGFKDVTNNEKSHGSCFSKKGAGTISSTCDTEVIPIFRKRGLSCVKECFAVLDTVYNHELSEPFRHEVKSKDDDKVTCHSVTVPDYYKTIKRGMCYDMIAHKLRNGIYQKMDEFTDDMKLIFDNCFQYHTEGSLTYLAGIEMQKFFEKKMQEIFTNIKFT